MLYIVTFEKFINVAHTYMFHITQVIFNLNVIIRLVNQG